MLPTSHAAQEKTVRSVNIVCATRPRQCLATQGKRGCARQKALRRGVFVTRLYLEARRMATTPKRIHENTWWKKFVPKKNHLDNEASWDGYMYETYGDELEFVRTQPDTHVWTFLQADDKHYVVSGYHLVNRLGYFVTEKPWVEETQFRA